MQTLPPREKRRSAMAAIARWWRDGGGTGSCPTRLDWAAPRDDDAGLLALDLAAAADLRALARHGPEEANLLPRRMAALGLDPDDVARLEPRVFRQLCWHCLLCESQGRCAWRLADDFAAPEWPDRPDDWRDYCPNAAALTTLSELPWFRATNAPPSA